MTLRLRAAAAVAMLWTVGALVACLATAVLVALVLLIIELVQGPSVILVGVAAVCGFAAFVAATYARGVLGWRRHRDLDESGVQLDPGQHAIMHTVVRTLADAVGSRPPTEIRVVAEPTIRLCDQGSLLGLLPGRSRLLLGLPVLLGLDRGQLRSVVAHELGHYSGGLGAVTYRGWERVTRLGARGPSRPVLAGPISWFCRSYVRLADPVVTRQEELADASAAAVTSAEVTASALMQVRRLQVAWEYLLATVLYPAKAIGRRPTEIAPAFFALLDDEEIAAEISAYLDEEPTEGPTRWDRHRPLTERVAAVWSQATNPGEPADSDPAMSFLDRPHAVVAMVEAEVNGDSPLEGVEWEELVRTTAEVRARHRAGLVNAACTSETPGRHSGPGVTVWELVEIISSGEVAELLSPVVPELGRPPAVACTDLITGFLATALVDAGRARFAFEWTAPGRLVTPTDGPLPLETWVADAVADPVATHALARALDDLGLDSGTTVAADAGPRHQPPAPRAVVTHVRTGRSRWANLVVTDTGLLLLPLPRARGLVETAVRVVAPATADQPLSRLVDATVTDLGATPGAHLVTWSDLEAVTLQRSRWTAVRLTATEPAIALVTTPVSRTYGRPFAVVADHLEDRCRWEGRKPARPV